ncbi:tetratricopeptide repeat protein [Streptomyces sp. NPDC048172]|uniref:tetratricopeptide repeat protein n=1 Tax=Streptomyces sp. NPDC048172 TaxID=3365505 RepID=UPI003714A085
MPARDMFRTTVHEASPPARPVVTHGLPQDIAGFTGREDELERLLAAASPGRAMNVHTVDGMPGTGKTALVTRAAHLLAGHFPDGQFFHDLHAHSPGLPSARPVDVLAVLLTDLGIDPRNLPPTLEGRSHLWRDRLAGKRVLLVLDDAAGHAQIEPLLPGSSPGCLTLVTSRRRLIALDGAAPLSLDPLLPGEAADLFTGRCHRTPTGGEKEAVAELVRLCGYLPLAIVLLAGRLRHRARWPLTRFATEFAEAQDRLGELVGESRAVYTAFALSYKELPEDQRRLFRRIGLHPGPDLDAYAAAALDDAPLTATRRRLDALYTGHFLEEPDLGRYQLHGLLRAYARTLTADHDPADERAQAGERLLDYYQHTTQAADALLTGSPRLATAPVTPPSAAPELRDRAGALAWMRAEHANLLASLETLATDQAPRTVGLTAAMAAFLFQEGPLPQAAALHQRAVAAARHLDDTSGEAHALNDLGRVRSQTDNLTEAIRLHEQALALFEGLGDRLGQARALNELGRVRNQSDEYAVAARLLQRALSLFEGLGDRLGQAGALHVLSRVRCVTGDFGEAARLMERVLDLHEALGDGLGWARALGELGRVRCLMREFEVGVPLLEQSLSLFEDLGDRLAQAGALHNLGTAHHLIGQYVESARLLEQARDRFEGLGAWLSRAHVLNELGRVRDLMGDYAEAARTLELSLSLHEALGYRRGQSNALWALGRVRYRTGDHAEAARLLQQALDRFGDLGVRLGRAHALNDLGRVRYLTHDFAEATRLLDQALSLFQEGGDPQGEANALNNIGALLADSRGPNAALPLFRQACELARRVRSPLEEARALEGAARCHARTGDRVTALAELREAVTLYRRIDAAEATAATAYLTSLRPEA